MARDYKMMHYIQSQLAPLGDDKLTYAITKAFNRMCAVGEHNGCLSTSVQFYIVMKYLGYSPKLCYGLVYPPDRHEIYHAWIELNGKIIDVAIFGNANYSPLAHFTVDKPIVYEEYDSVKEIMEYHPFEFDDDWHNADISVMQGRTIKEYCDLSPRGMMWKLTFDLLDMSPTVDNKRKLEEVLGEDKI